MQSVRLSESHYIVRLDKGEDILTVLQKFLESEKIHNAFLTALGSVENPVLAHYRVDTKKYTEKKLSGIFEVTNLTGNVALFEEKPLIHSHITLSDENMNAVGGHFIQGIVSATLEVRVEVSNTEIQKKFSEEIGLKLFDLPDAE